MKDKNLPQKTILLKLVNDDELKIKISTALTKDEAVRILANALDFIYNNDDIEF